MYPDEESIKHNIFFKTHYFFAMEYCQQALEIASQLGIPLVKECDELQAMLASDRAKDTP